MWASKKLLLSHVYHVCTEYRCNSPSKSVASPACHLWQTKYQALGPIWVRSRPARTLKIYGWHILAYQDITEASGNASKVLMKNLKAYSLSVAIIWPWPSRLGICWKVHLGPMEGVWHRFSFEEGKPKQRLKKVNQTLKNQMKTWLLLALKPYTNRLFESNIGPSPADLLALYPHTWAAYVMETSTYFNKTNSNQECPTITVTLWDSDHFFHFFPDLHPWGFRVLFMNFMSETVPATRYQSWNARESVLCSPLSASCRPIDVPGSLAGTSVGAAFGWSCTSRPRKCLARHVTKTMQ